MARLELRHNFRMLNAIINSHRKGIPVSRLEMHYSARRCVRNLLELLRHHRAIRNGTYLTRQHLARRPRGFHRVSVGDTVFVWKWVRGVFSSGVGQVDNVQFPLFGSPIVRVDDDWFLFAQTAKTGFGYVH